MQQFETNTEEFLATIMSVTTAQARLSMIQSHVKLRTPEELQPEFPLLPKSERAKYNGQSYYRTSRRRTDEIVETLVKMSEPRKVAAARNKYRYIPRGISKLVHNTPVGKMVVFCGFEEVIEGLIDEDVGNGTRILCLNGDSEDTKLESLEKYDVIYRRLTGIDEHDFTDLTYNIIVLNELGTMEELPEEELCIFLKAINSNVKIIRRAKAEDIVATTVSTMVDIVVILDMKVCIVPNNFGSEKSTQIP